MKGQVQASLVALAVVAVAAGVAVGRSSGVSAGLGVSAVALALTGAYGWWSLRTGPHVSWTQATEQLAQGQAVVLWKPGCVYCERLLRALGRNERVTWVNVWQDEDANARVRSLNDGNELTPTVLVGDQVLRNPSAGEVEARLSRGR